ncbi:PucR family transcriptional regulator [Neobacillus jeddahensis]|uniref:PucR family transcriptional regulator n=1 Tax=Neobacillus jeddahensis TaxID=1461580 RepID=UPI0005906C10|nr:helix-turn-helix domain-containing protein [Neobacillus jeddahensis]
MLRKLLTIYKDSILFHNQPEKPSKQFYYFWSESENEGIGIPKTEVSEKELILLTTIYKLVEYQAANLPPVAKRWYDFLLLDGPSPQTNSDTSIRFIQFHIHGSDTNPVEIESALKGFFTDDVLIIWENGSRGIVIEEKNQVSLSEEELISMSETVASDFYVKITFYLGKPCLFSEQLRAKYLQEKEYFSFALSKLGTTQFFSFERVFPAYLAYYLPLELKQRGSAGIVEVFQEDPELFSTIKVFLENNLNASLTAKKLYIHRNTLQYRIDKFTEKTGIGLKDFYSAFTIFLTCMLFESDFKQ